MPTRYFCDLCGDEVPHNIPTDRSHTQKLYTNYSKQEYDYGLIIAITPQWESDTKRIESFRATICDRCLVLAIGEYLLGEEFVDALKSNNLLNTAGNGSNFHEEPAPIQNHSEAENIAQSSEQKALARRVNNFISRCLKRRA